MKPNFENSELHESADIRNSELAKDVINILSEQSKQCKSIDEYLDLVFSFRFHEFSIAPIQIRNEIYVLLQILAKHKPKTLLEIGTARGGTLFLFCKLADPEAIITSIDLPKRSFSENSYTDWKITVYESFATNKQKIHLIRSDSHDGTTLEKLKQVFSEAKIDFLFIDGDHTYEGVKSDFEMYSPLVADGGIIAFHDINQGPKQRVGGVPEYWNEIKSKHPTLEIVGNQGPKGYGVGLLILESDNKISPNYIEASRIVFDFKDTQINNLNKIHQIVSILKGNPMGLLLYIYCRRKDLQRNYPEIINGQYDRLLEWAGKFGVTNDRQKDTLLQYKDWYLSHSSQKNLNMLAKIFHLVIKKTSS